MNQINEYIKRASNKFGFKREVFLEKNIPTTSSNIIILPFYGDIRSTFDLSTFILRQYKEKYKDKYLILCSWPGFQDIFPYVDEYWTLAEESSAKTLAMDTNNLYNGTNISSEINRSMLEVAETISYKDLRGWYDKGFTKKYWEDFSEIKRYLPEVQSSSKLSDSFIKELDRKLGKKVVVYPVTKMTVWHQGKSIYLPVSKQFWETLIQSLLSEGFVPVIYQNWWTFDMSKEFTDKCVYLVPRNISDVLAAIRHVGLVLDVHSGISRLAIAARTPFICVDERIRYINSGDFAVDDLCCQTPRKYIFSFSTLLMQGGPSEWKDSLLDNILVNLHLFNPTNRGNWGATNESYQNVSYELVKNRKSQRRGVFFISSSKNKEKLNVQKCN